MKCKVGKLCLLGQVLLSILITLFGVFNCIRCLMAGQIFCTVCFAIIGYVSGYHFLFRASLDELRKHNTKRTTIKI